MWMRDGDEPKLLTLMLPFSSIALRETYMIHEVDEWMWMRDVYVNMVEGPHTTPSSTSNPHSHAYPSTSFTHP